MNGAVMRSDGNFGHAAHDPTFRTMHENESICISIGSVLTDPGSRPLEQFEVRKLSQRRRHHASQRPERTASGADPSFRRSRLALALVEAAVEHLLGDAVFQNLHRATGNHPAAGAAHAIL